MNSKVKTALSFGIPVAIMMIAFELIFDTPRDSNQDVLTTVIKGLLTGILSGFLFAWITIRFSRSKYVLRTTSIETNPGEKIIFAGPANHFKGMEAVGGKLYLTKNRIVFQSHKVNIQNHQLSIDLADVEGASSYKVMGIAKRGLSVLTTTHKEEKFVVERPDDWIRQLNEARTGYGKGVRV